MLRAQEMISVETFVGFIRKKDVGRIRFAIRETLYDLDATDEVGTYHLLVLEIRSYFFRL